MKLVLAIVQDTDAGHVVDALLRHGYPGPTRIPTRGGFLRRGNVTLLLGTEEERVAGAIDLIRQAVQGRGAGEPAEAGQATIFVLDTARFIRI